MSLFFREMKASRKSLLFWSIGIIFLVVSGMNKYDAYAKSGQSLNDLMGSMPKSLQVLFGMNSMDMSTVLGYYGVLFFYIVLMATIHAAMLGSNIISKEERDKTSEFLMTKPISRTNIISLKLLAAVVQVIIFNIVTFVSSVMVVQYYGKESFSKEMTMLMIALCILQLLFLAVGVVVAAMSKNPKRATNFSTILLLITFLLSMIIDMSEKMEALKYLTPFQYFPTKDLIEGSGFDPVFVVLAILLIIGLMLMTYVYYPKRDLRV